MLCYWTKGLRQLALWFFSCGRIISTVPPAASMEVECLKNTLVFTFTASLCQCSLKNTGPAGFWGIGMSGLGAIGQSSCIQHPCFCFPTSLVVRLHARIRISSHCFALLQQSRTCAICQVFHLDFTKWIIQVIFCETEVFCAIIVISHDSSF